MNDFAALFGDLGEWKDDIKLYGSMGAGAVGGLMAFRWLSSKVAPSIPALGGWREPVLYGVEVAAGILSTRYLPRLLGRFGAIGSFVTQGVAIGLVADGLLGLLHSVPNAIKPGFELPLVGKLPKGFLGDQDVLFQRYLAAAPVSVELAAAPVSVELAGPRMAATLS